jgi:hypothetical protein
MQHCLSVLGVQGWTQDGAGQVHSADLHVPESVADRMLLVLKAPRELDIQCRSQAESAGMEVENQTVAKSPCHQAVDRSVFHMCMWMF